MYDFTDTALEADIAAGGYGRPGGIHPRQAAELIKAPEEYRQRIYNEAGTLTNVLGGVLSGTIYDARVELMRNLEAGEPERELYGERYAREAREREEEIRQALWNAGAHYPTH